MRRVIEAIPTAILTSILTTFFLALWAPNISNYVSLFRPTCEDPQGLVEIPRTEIRAAADSEIANYSSRNLLDGRVVNVWVPRILPKNERPAGVSRKREFAAIDPDQNLVTLTLKNESDVQLVCVVNGLANDYSNYLNFARVRSVRAWTDADPSKELSVLKSMDEGSFQNFQDVRISRGDATKLMIQVLDAYEGQHNFSRDPDHCKPLRTKANEADPGGGQLKNGQKADPLGCIRTATPSPGLAEIKVYRLEESRWKTLFT
ncbi:hypothetical protein [Aeromicrobium sp.]|uniref:hypothetical protein n=1 Tax=Aeromicrobium sp. TaxID=1871063 RepID=UPI003D6AC045